MGDETDFETCFETTVPGRVQRLDVIESSRGKRHWTPQARARIIAARCATKAAIGPSTGPIPTAIAVKRGNCSLTETPATSPTDQRHRPDELGKGVPLSR